MCLETIAHTISKHQPYCCTFLLFFIGPNNTHFMILWLNYLCPSLWFLIMIILGRQNSKLSELPCERFHTLTGCRVYTQVLQFVIYLTDPTNWESSFGLSLRYQLYKVLVYHKLILQIFKTKYSWPYSKHIFTK